MSGRREEGREEWKKRGRKWEKEGERGKEAGRQAWREGGRKESEGGRKREGGVIGMESKKWQKSERRLEQITLCVVNRWGMSRRIGIQYS